MAKTTVNKLAADLGVSPEQLLPVLAEAKLVRPGASETSYVSDREAAVEAWQHRGNGGNESPTEGSVAALIQEYQDQGLTELNVTNLDIVAPELKGDRKKLSLFTPLGANEDKTREMLNTLTAVARLLERDRSGLENWAGPSAEYMASGADPLVYPGICGHTVEMTRRVYQMRTRNWEQGNAKTSPLLRLCADCRARRISLLTLIPGSANSMSVCTFCEQPTFGGEDKAASLAMSRGDLWENLISGVFPLYMLPERLGTDHRASHSEHIKLMAVRGQTFDDWMRVYREQVHLKVSQSPEMGRELKEGMERTIKAKRIELGLADPED